LYAQQPSHRYPSNTSGPRFPSMYAWSSCQGKAKVTVGVLILATRELLDAELAVSATPKERIAALAGARDRALAFEAKVKSLHDAAARGGELDKLAHSHLALLDSQVRLARKRRQQATCDTPATEK
jgi:hypothetical protein